jgi:glycerol-3-phosphate dehydrogenase
MTEPDVLIIGGGINGVGLFRDLSLQNVSVALVEKTDWCAGTSAASGRVIHGGLRYLENGEFRLVREALHERNRLLKNAPHYVKPLPIMIPVFTWFDGVVYSIKQFPRLQDKPGNRGVFMIKARWTTSWEVRTCRSNISRHIPAARSSSSSPTETSSGWMI